MFLSSYPSFMFSSIRSTCSLRLLFAYVFLHPFDVSLKLPFVYVFLHSFDVFSPFTLRVCLSPSVRYVLSFYSSHMFSFIRSLCSVQLPLLPRILSKTRYTFNSFHILSFCVIVQGMSLDAFRHFHFCSLHVSSRHKIHSHHTTPVSLLLRSVTVI